MSHGKLVLLFVTCFVSACLAQAQFPPAAGITGTTAIYKEDDRFVQWATGCEIRRGWQNISDTSLGFTSVGNETSAIGKAGENGVVSLGDGGSATLTFQTPIANGSGPDFAVFENGFSVAGSSLAFLEFAFVEVSSDGENFVRFPAVSNIQDSIQLAMEGMDASLINNLAGKYVGGYGTPFDLEDLKDSIHVDINRITHVRLVDVVGSINPLYATHDHNGKKINDPWPTTFPSSGFDLDAVGVLHALQISGIEDASLDEIKLFPNPSSRGPVQLSIGKILNNGVIHVKDALGNNLLTERLTSGLYSIDTRNYPPGIYLIATQDSSGTRIVKMILE